MPQGLTPAEQKQGRDNLGLADVSASGSYNDLTDKPAIPTVNNAVLTIQKNGSTIETFSANSASDKIANIVVPTKTSEITNNSGYITSADLPTVGNGTITIKRNNSTVDSFTTNQSGNKSINISVPTKTSDITNDSGFITSSDLPTVNDGTLTIKLDGTTVQTFSANESADKTANIVLPQVYAIQNARESYFPSSNSWPVIGNLTDDGATTTCTVKFPSDVTTKNITVASNGTITFQQKGVYHIHLDIPVEVTHAAEDTAATVNYVYATAAVYKTGSSDTKGWVEVRGNINRRISELNTYWIKVDFDAVVGDLDAVFSCEMRLHGLNLSTNTGMDIAVHKPIGSITRVC